jgi:uncharacterized surface protein with fasciclin (FAS1) repeats
MTDLPTTETAEDDTGEDEDDDRGFPLLWGFLLVGVVTVLAVLLFRDVDFGDGSNAVATVTTVSAAATTTEPPPTTFAEAAPEPAEPATIADLLAADGRFGVLLGVVDRLGLGDTLSGEGPLTLFAPTDDAFSGIDLVDDDDALRSLVLRHLAAGRVASSDLAGGDGTIEMLDGSTLEVDLDSSPATIGEAPISQTDLEAGNGIVHVIDAPIAGAVSTISERLLEYVCCWVLAVPW